MEPKQRNFDSPFESSIQDFKDLLLSLRDKAVPVSLLDENAPESNSEIAPVVSAGRRLMLLLSGEKYKTAELIYSDTDREQLPRIILTQQEKPVLEPGTSVVDPELSLQRLKHETEFPWLVSWDGSKFMLSEHLTDHWLEERKRIQLDNSSTNLDILEEMKSSFTPEQYLEKRAYLSARKLALEQDRVSVESSFEIFEDELQELLSELQNGTPITDIDVSLMDYSRHGAHFDRNPDGIELVSGEVPQVEALHLSSDGSRITKISEYEDGSKKVTKKEV